MCLGLIGIYYSTMDVIRYSYLLAKFSPFCLFLFSPNLTSLHVYFVFQNLNCFTFVSLLEIEQILSTVDDTTFGKLMQQHETFAVLLCIPSLRPSLHPLL